MRHTTRKLTYVIATLIGCASLVALPASAITAAAVTKNTKATSAAASAKATAQAAAQQARLQRIITRGNLEIERRLVTLNTLTTKINSATKLTSADAATLKGTVSGDITTLNTLKIQLDADTTVATAISDATSVITNYRVYVLVTPQVNLIKAADDQQGAEAKLATLATKLSARITAEQQKGTNVTTLQATLADMNSKTAAAQSVSGTTETTVITLVPSDYNTNHAVLSGDRTQLVGAQANIKAAEADAQTIISQLKASSPTPASP